MAPSFRRHTHNQSPITLEGSNFLANGHVILSQVPDNITATPLPYTTNDKSITTVGCFVGFNATESTNRHVVSIGKLRDIRFKVRWTTHWDGSNGRDIENEPQMVILQNSDLGCPYVLLLPLVEGSFRASFQPGQNDNVDLCVESGSSKATGDSFRAIMYMHPGEDPSSLVKEAMKVVKIHLGDDFWCTDPSGDPNGTFWLQGCITKKRKLEPSLSFEAKPENSMKDEIISSIASERREREPIFYNFMPIPEVDQYQCSKEYVFTTKTHDESKEVSTETCIPQKRKATENLVNLSPSSTALGAKRMKLNSHEGPNGVSLELKLGSDPWDIKKKITPSDIGHLSRLLLRADLVKKHILPVWNAERSEKIEDEKIKDGVVVGVWDCDTKSEHQLLFKQWPSNGSYVLIGKWTVEFVKRRGLKKDDEIGLYWDQRKSKFHFKILKRALSNPSSL